MKLAILALLAVLTFHQAQIWSTPETLWSHAVMQSPLRPRPHLNLATAYAMTGQYPKALEESQTAELLSLRPGTDIHEVEMTRVLVAMNIAYVLDQTGHFEEARQVLKQGWRVNPGFPGYALNLSSLYMRKGEPDQAILFLADGIEHFDNYQWFPRKGRLYVNLGLALQMMGHCPEAHQAYIAARHYESFAEPQCS